VHRLLQRVTSSTSTTTAANDNDHRQLGDRNTVDVDVVVVTSLPSSPSSSSWFHVDSELTRTRLLSVGKHYKPPASPTLTVIDEDVDEDDIVEQRDGKTTLQLLPD